MMRTVRRFVEPRADPVHVVLASPITLPTGTTPQNLVTVDLTSHIAQRLADYAAAGAWIVPLGIGTLSTRWWALVFFHFSRSSNSGSVTLYYSLSGEYANTASGGSNLSISTFHRTTVSDTGSVTLQASQTSAAGWTLYAYTIVCIPFAVSLIGSASQAVTGGGTLNIGNNIYTTPIAVIGNYTDANDLIIVPSGVNVSYTYNRHNYAAVLVQSLTATSPATTTSSPHGVNLSQAAVGRDLLYTGVHYVAQDILTPAVFFSSTTANVRSIAQFYRITGCNVYVLR